MAVLRVPSAEVWQETLSPQKIEEMTRDVTNQEDILLESSPHLHSLRFWRQAPCFSPHVGKHLPPHLGSHWMSTGAIVCVGTAFAGMSPGPGTETERQCWLPWLELLEEPAAGNDKMEVSIPGQPPAGRSYCGHWLGLLPLVSPYVKWAASRGKDDPRVAK